MCEVWKGAGSEGVANAWLSAPVLDKVQPGEYSPSLADHPNQNCMPWNADSKTRPIRPQDLTLVQFWAGVRVHVCEWERFDLRSPGNLGTVNPRRLMASFCRLEISSTCVGCMGYMGSFFQWPFLSFLAFFSAAFGKADHFSLKLLPHLASRTPTSWFFSNSSGCALSGISEDWGAPRARCLKGNQVSRIYAQLLGFTSDPFSSRPIFLFKIFCIFIKVIHAYSLKNCINLQDVLWKTAGTVTTTISQSCNFISLFNWFFCLSLNSSR